MISTLDFDVVTDGMGNAIAPLPKFITATPTGLLLAKDLTFEEWNAIGSSFGTALQSAAWCIGDWMVYGERKWGKQLLLDSAEFDPKVPNRIPSHAFDLAVEATGLDRQTISKYAEVARRIPMEERRERLSFGHHRVLAPLPTPERLAWMSMLTDSESVKPPTVKRLALSVRIAEDRPRIVTDEEITSRGEHVGHDNYVPHLTRLLTVLRKTLPGMTDEQREALREDTEQLRDILNAL
jgi:hypothetical protein